jgi:hypothetical protein
MQFWHLFSWFCINKIIKLNVNSMM